MPHGTAVTPNRRGLRSRELLLDAAERVMAEHGYDGATVALVVERSQIPLSSVYHYYGSKEGLLLAVMERGRQRYYENLPGPDLTSEDVRERLRATIRTTIATLERFPDFLTLLLAFSVQSKEAQTLEMQAIITRVRETGQAWLQVVLAAIFDDDPTDDASLQLARFTLNVTDGAFVMSRSNASVPLVELLEPLVPAIIAVRADLRNHRDPGGDEQP